MDDKLAHYGILGMKWGVRRFQDKNGRRTKAGEVRYSEESDKVIKTNRDGSKTIPSGFVFNRVGKSVMDVNQSGAFMLAMEKKTQQDTSNR